MSLTYRVKDTFKKAPKDSSQESTKERLPFKGEDIEENVEGVYIDNTGTMEPRLNFILDSRQT